MSTKIQLMSQKKVGGALSIHSHSRFKSFDSESKRAFIEEVDANLEDDLISTHGLPPPSTYINLAKISPQISTYTRYNGGKRLTDDSLNLYEIREAPHPSNVPQSQVHMNQFREFNRYETGVLPKNYEPGIKVKTRQFNYWKNRIERDFKPTVDEKKRVELELLR